MKIIIVFNVNAVIMSILLPLTIIVNVIAVMSILLLLTIVVNVVAVIMNILLK